MIRTWLVSLEKLFGPVVTLRITLQKLALDQLAFAPFSQATILSSVGLLQGFSFEMIKDKVQKEQWKVMTTGWKVTECISQNFRTLDRKIFANFSSGRLSTWSIFILYPFC